MEHAVVIGGGPAGLTTALALRKEASVRQVTVLERRTDPLSGWQGAAINLTSGLPALRELGVDLEKRSIGQPLKRVVARSAPRGQFLYEGNLGAVGALSVLRGELQRELVDECEREGGAVDVRRGEEVEKVEQNSGKGVTTVTTSTSMEADLTVVAAGGRGARLATLPMPLPSGQEIFISLGPTSGDKRPEEAEQTFGDGAYLLRVTAGEEEAAFLSVPTKSMVFEDDWETALGDERRVKEAMLSIMQRKGFFANQIDAVERGTSYAKIASLATPPSPRSWVQAGGSLVALGDAAHAMPPYLGQGANQALQDAVALGKTLKGGRPLSSWERARRGSANAARDVSKIIGFIETASHPFSPLRDASMRVAGALRLPDGLLSITTRPSF